MPSDPHTSKARNPAWFALAVACFLLVAACGSETDASSELAVGNAADGGTADFPQFTAATVDGSQLDFGSLEGQETVLWFWAPW